MFDMYSDGEDSIALAEALAVLAMLHPLAQMSLWSFLNAMLLQQL